ncbi:TPA: HNH endonuclease [Shigella dysenteriae]
MKRHSPPDIQELTSSLDYDPLTGKFTWKKQRASNCIIGKEAGYITGYGYRQIHFNGKAYKAHRLAWFITYGTWPDLIDHIDMDRANNAIANLREATTSENSRNQSIKRRNSSGAPCVYWHSTRNRWVVKVTREGREYYGGVFTNFDDAKLASEKLRKELHGEFYREVSRKGVQS